MTDFKRGTRYWVIRNGKRVDLLLRDGLGAIDRWDASTEAWVPAQDYFDDIYSIDSWDTYPVSDETELEEVKAALADRLT